jgi:hypothetical protein
MSKAPVAGLKHKFFWRSGCEPPTRTPERLWSTATRPTKKLAGSTSFRDAGGGQVADFFPSKLVRRIATQHLGVFDPRSPTRIVAQEFRAFITDLVADNTGAVTPAASVKAVNTETGVVYSAQSDSSGSYSVLYILPVLDTKFPLGDNNQICVAKMRRYLGCLVSLALLVALQLGAGHAQEWESGQSSPVHDSDRLYPIGANPIVLENARVSLSFDRTTGALVSFINTSTGWHWQTDPRFSESFNLFVPTADRSYNPVLGAKNRLASFEKSADGQTLTLVWSNLDSEYQGKLDIVLHATVHLQGDSVRFEMTVTNHCRHTISSLSWPIIGSITNPQSVMKASTWNYGNLSSFPLWNPASQSLGYYGTNYPIRILDGRFVLVSTPEQGLYVGAHNSDAKENVRYMFEVKPGFEDSYGNVTPKSSSISGHPVRLTMQIVHFPFLNPGESGQLAPIVLGPYRGDWHAGVDIYKRWLTAWFHPLDMPAWVQDIHAWQQLQINSSEDDQRTRYVDLPERVAEDAKHGITVLQLVGWNLGGQDRDNPSDNTDPRLGTTPELKRAIARIQKDGVHVVLFAKYAWADTSTDWYKKELYKHMATDPYADIYTWAGYRYQTPEQLAGINPRNLATACPNDAEWRKILAGEFQKVIDLGANGVLFDEAQHRHSSDYNLCFNPNHGHHVPATIWSGDVALANMYRSMIHSSVGERNFLFSGEEPEDVLGEAYSLSYLRINKGHTPEERYAFPFRPMMIAVTGFNDREMINRALMYRYIISYEPFNFKGDIKDFPLTTAYGEKMDALRRRYRDYLWDAEFRDTVGASVKMASTQYKDYTVFDRKDGRRAVVVTNDNANQTIDVTVTLAAAAGHSFACASPENLEAVRCAATVSIPPRSAIVMMEH